MAIETRLSEAAVCQLWDSQRFGQTALACVDGTPVQCVYRGRWRRCGGPDFVDALLAFDAGDLRRGDVEVHLHSMDWFVHRHHLNPAYNQVILHVVLHHDGTDAKKANGESVPTLALENYLPDSPPMRDRGWGEPDMPEMEPCRTVLRRRGASYLGFALDRAGRQRLIDRATRFEGEFAAVGSEQCLYSAILDALGYSANRQPFRELAAALPWSTLESLLLSQSPSDRSTVAQSLLFGIAGRLPSARCLSLDRPVEDASYVNRLESIWRRYAPGWESTPAPNWRQWGLRLSNHPDRRLAAAAHYLASVAPRGLAADFERIVKGLPTRRVASALRQHFAWASRADRYWTTRYSFARFLPAPQGCLIGSGRAADISVNVVLPFLLASANAGLGDCGREALEVYRHHPVLADNEVTRVIRGLLGDSQSRAVVNSAQRQQGLIHVYQRYCRDQRCQECPLA